MAAETACKRAGEQAGLKASFYCAAMIPCLLGGMEQREG